jgi:hypothetical protein|tara:strand:- start:2417 stop:2530 length:114 start_codon:yes stop_codon:yes gene_type:complete
MNKEMEHEAVKQELSSLIETTLKLEDELNTIVGTYKD